MEAVAADDDGRMRRFLDNNAPKRPAPEFPRIGGAAPAVAAPTVRTVGGVSSGSSAGGARPSPMADQNEESTRHNRGQSTSSAPAAADASIGIPEQREAKRVRHESLEEPSQDGRERFSLRRASETDAEELEPDNSKRPRSSTGSWLTLLQSKCIPSPRLRHWRE